MKTKSCKAFFGLNDPDSIRLSVLCLAFALILLSPALIGMLWFDPHPELRIVEEFTSFRVYGQHSLDPHRIDGQVVPDYWHKPTARGLNDVRFVATGGQGQITECEAPRSKLIYSPDADIRAVLLERYHSIPFRGNYTDTVVVFFIPEPCHPEDYRSVQFENGNLEFQQKII